MARECCHNCLYAWWDICQMVHSFTTGFAHRPACANHPDSLGRMRTVRIGAGICRNYRRRPADPAQGAKRIPVSDGLYAYVDVADHEWLSRWTWHLQDGYAVRWEKGKKIYMHRQIMQPPENMKVDHASRNRLDNTRYNLRICTHQQNMYNRGKRAGSISRFKGVGFRKRDKKWYAELGAAKKPIWLGFFDDEIEAAHAYDLVAVQHFGEFAYVNFPDEWPRDRCKEVHAKWLEEQARQRTEDREPKAAKQPAAKARTEGGRRRTADKRRATEKDNTRAKTQRRGERKRAAKEGNRRASPPK